MLQYLCETSDGSKHIQIELDRLINNNCYETRINTRQLLVRFFDKIESFAHQLCLNYYGSFVVNNFLNNCSKYIQQK